MKIHVNHHRADRTVNVEKYMVNPCAPVSQNILEAHLDVDLNVLLVQNATPIYHVLIKNVLILAREYVA